MLYEIAHLFPADMNFQEEGPHISLYQATHRSFPDKKQNQIVFKNQLRVIEDSLKQLQNFDAIETIMKPFYELKEDKEFWNHTADGIAVFATPNKCLVYNLHNPVSEFAVVANRFHIKPLIKAFQSTEEYQLLGLSRDNFTLYQGNRFEFTEIELGPDVPRTMKEALGDELSSPYLSHGSYAGAGGPTMYHGHGDVKEEIDKDTEKYFRYVDSFIYENYSKTSKLPLILVSLAQYQTDFKRLSNNKYLLEKGISKSAESLNLEEIGKQARKIIEAINAEKIQKKIDSYNKAQAESRGSSDLKQVVQAAFEGRVDTILIQEDKIIPGKVDFSTGKIITGDINDPDLADILDDLAELVLANSGRTIILAEDEMPSTTGVAAIYRYS